MLSLVRKLSILLILGFTILNQTLAQDLMQNDLFKYAPLYNGDVVFLQEIPLTSAQDEKSFLVVKSWGKKQFASNPFVSNIRYDNQNKEIIVKSTIELVLPEDNHGIRQKVKMSYKLNSFIVNGKGIFEIKGISYKISSLKKTWKASETITKSALEIQDSHSLFRKNIERSTLYFVNELANSLKDELKNQGLTVEVSD